MGQWATITGEAAFSRGQGGRIIIIDPIWRAPGQLATYWYTLQRSPDCLLGALEGDLRFEPEDIADVSAHS